VALYIEYVVKKGYQSVLHVHVKKAIYGLLVSTMLLYRKLKNDLLEQGFEVNPYDPCVDGKQLTVGWNVDDLKASHMQPQVVDSFIDWGRQKFGTVLEGNSITTLSTPSCEISKRRKELVEPSESSLTLTLKN
jgi:hypothetical protein